MKHRKITVHRRENKERERERKREKERERERNDILVRRFDDNLFVPFPPNEILLGDSQSLLHLFFFFSS